MDLRIKNKKTKIFFTILFILYIVLLLGVVTLRFWNPDQLLQMREALDNGTAAPNFKPFATLINQIQNITTGYALWNIAANTICFIPFGFILPLVSLQKTGVIITTLWGMLFSVIIEFLQYAFNLGLFDVDDIILNTVGVLIGYILILIFWKLRYRNKTVGR
ncbi:MAG: VanZ family protein [Ruminococcus sp.]|jgi:glycopeptide antibiotics resistance protein|nr:VanZ family protein [Ruminococcus sp.]